MDSPRRSAVMRAVAAVSLAAAPATDTRPNFGGQNTFVLRLPLVATRHWNPQERGEDGKR